MKHFFSKLLLTISIFLTFLSYGYTQEINQLRSLETPQIYSSRDSSLKGVLMEEIANAKESLLFFTFTFSDVDIINLINQKSETGVEVTIIIDNEHQSTLQKLGSGHLNIITREGQGRVHHKILVVDNENVWLGSANFTSAAYKKQENLFIGVKSKTFAKALIEEAKIFEEKKCRTEVLDLQELYEDELVKLFILPFSKPYGNSLETKMNKKAKDEIIYLLDNATNSIRIAMMVWTDPDLEKAVIEAHKRGVLVEILLQDKKDVVSKNLQDAGIIVKVNPNLNFLHNKLLWIDGNILVNGSANWSRSAFSRNDESFFVLENLSEEHRVYLEEYWTTLFLF